uniref:Uncharacterized protein n=1 Tax=viral metagenome TaxID=1070528 RepID=A0A6C0D3G4_9ZZZZ
MQTNHNITNDAHNDDDNNESWKSIALPDIDKLTLECFMNRTRYNKYVEKTDPKKSVETEQYLANIRKYCSKIKDITADLLDDPTMPVTSEVNEMFDAYMKTLIKHFQTKELERKEGFSNYNCDNDEEETLFGEMDDNSKEQNIYSVSPKMNSFWSGERVIRKK